MIMPEYYQSKAKPDLIAREAVSIVKNGRLDAMRAELAEVKRKLGAPGASKRAAKEVLEVAVSSGPRR
jgi:lipid A disaccharide synthetase